MWSEHYPYKNSIVWLKKLPKDGPHMLVESNLKKMLGLVDIGDGLKAVVSKLNLITTHRWNLTKKHAGKALAELTEIFLPWSAQPINNLIL